MGTLMLPPTGSVYVDSVVIIHTVEQHPTYWPLLQPLWDAAKRNVLEVVSSELALMEVLVGPLKSGDAAIRDAYERALTGTDLRLIPVTEPVLREAARLRAVVSRLRTPDAIHAATALTAGCALFLTNDHGLRNIPGLPVTVLSDLLTP